ncbi:MAG: FGGY-family carbohydrate kinase, partial [Orrella sp.]
FDIPHSVLREVVPSAHVGGHCSKETLGAGIPIAARTGDQQAATVGQACFTPGMAKNTYGTGCFLLMNTGAVPAHSRHRLLTTVGWQLPEDQQSSELEISEQEIKEPQHRNHKGLTYCLEGSVFMGGATVQWLRDGLELIETAADIEALASSVPDTGDVFLVPALTGLGAPIWDGDARGLLVGMTRGTTKAHIARAALQGIALQVADVLTAMQADAETALTQLRVDGGASANNLLMQMQADLLGIEVVRPKITETTALGAAYLAGLTMGVWPDHEALRQHWTVDRVFEPLWSSDQRLALLDRWKQAVERSRGWIQTPDRLN